MEIEIKINIETWTSQKYISIFLSWTFVSITGIYNRLQYYMFADFSIIFFICHSVPFHIPVQVYLKKISSALKLLMQVDFCSHGLYKFFSVQTF